VKYQSIRAKCGFGKNVGGMYVFFIEKQSKCPLLLYVVVTLK